MSGKAEKLNPGQQPHVPDLTSKATVLALKGIGASNKVIAHKLEICRNTLEKYYEHELEVGPEFANSLVAQNLHTIATGGTKGAPFSAVVRAATFWLERRAGWKNETKSDGPIPPPTAGPPVAPARRIMFGFLAPEGDLDEPLEEAANQ